MEWQEFRQLLDFWVTDVAKRDIAQQESPSPRTPQAKSLTLVYMMKSLARTFVQKAFWTIGIKCIRPFRQKRHQRALLSPLPCVHTIGTGVERYRLPRVNYSWSFTTICWRCIRQRCHCLFSRLHEGYCDLITCPMWVRWFSKRAHMFCVSHWRHCRNFTHIIEGLFAIFANQA